MELKAGMLFTYTTKAGFFELIDHKTCIFRGDYWRIRTHNLTEVGSRKYTGLIASMPTEGVLQCGYIGEDIKKANLLFGDSKCLSSY